MARLPLAPTVVATLLLAALAALAAAVLVVFGGWYDVAADRPHTQLVYSLMETTMRASVQRRAAAIEPRPLADGALGPRGAVCFRDHCVACHGAPGQAPDALARTLQPVPGPLVDAAQHWRTRELVWIVRHGIRMSGMPAWRDRLSDDDIWALALFIEQLPALSPTDYAALQAQHQALRCEAGARGIVQAPAGDVQLAEVGRQAMQRHACHACHQIPGVVGSRRWVGPPLAGFAHQQLIAGRLSNTPDNLARWIEQPQQVDPGTAMPDLGVGSADARAMAAYLATLR
jgi:mono/diheme cytochrome c family protein